MEPQAERRPDNSPANPKTTKPERRFIIRKWSHGRGPAFNATICRRSTRPDRVAPQAVSRAEISYSPTARGRAEGARSGPLLAARRASFRRRVLFDDSDAKTAVLLEVHRAAPRRLARRR